MVLIREVSRDGRRALVVDDAGDGLTVGVAMLGADGDSGAVEIDAGGDAPMSALSGIDDPADLVLIERWAEAVGRWWGRRRAGRERRGHPSSSWAAKGIEGIEGKY